MERKGFIPTLPFSDHDPSLGEVRTGTRAWRQELSSEAVLLTGVLPLASSDCFLIQLRTTWPGMVAAVDYTFPHQSTIRKMSYRLAYSQF